MVASSRLAAIGIGALLAGLIAFEIATPGRLLGSAAEDGAPVGDALGHVRAHAQPELLCTAPTDAATLVARPATWSPNRRERLDVWAFDGTVPGPLLCARAGAAFTLTLTNALPQPLPFHVHGLAPDVLLAPGDTREIRYDIPADAAGVHVYHALDESDVARGLAGVLLVKGDAPARPDVDHEVLLTLGEATPPSGEGAWAATLNGRAYPDAPHFRFEEGERVLFHIVNLGDAVHTLHVHGHRWFDPADGRPIDNKLLAPHVAPDLTGETQTDFVLVAGEPGDWMYHCHIYDHINAGMTGTLTVVPRGSPTVGGVEHDH